MPRPIPTCLATVGFVVAGFVAEPPLAQWIDRGAPAAGLASSIECVSRIANRIDCFARGSDQEIHWLFWDGENWFGWARTGRSFAGAPSCVSPSSNRVDCVALGTGGLLNHVSIIDDRIGTWRVIGSDRVSGYPDCVSPLEGRIDCFVRGGSDGAIHQTTWIGSRWSGLARLGGDPSEEPVCLVRRADTIDCFIRGYDGAMHHNSWDGSSWSGFQSRGGAIVGKPSCTSWAPDRIDCVALGTDGAIHRNFVANDVWSGWQLVEGPPAGTTLVSAPHCFAFAGEFIDCYVRGADRELYRKRWGVAAWTAWIPMQVTTAATFSFGCVSRATNRLDCLVGRDNGQTAHRWWHGCSWNEPPEPHRFPPVSSDPVTIPSFPEDRDGDGLPDRWEIERTAWGLNPDRADLIVVPVLRPNVAKVDVEPNLEMTREFYRHLPVRSLDGSIGLNVVIRWGNPLDESFRDDAVPWRDYPEARGVGIPAELRGYGHGLLVGGHLTPGACGGGQTSSGDWAAVDNNWPTFVHELGHQLGLNHEPLGSPVPSPLYTSLMNYDYSYSFEGDPYKIHFSRGRFSGYSLDERDLNETLPLPIEDLRFLERRPYEFSLRSLDTSLAEGLVGGTVPTGPPRSGALGTALPPISGIRPLPGGAARPSTLYTQIDWNRNGVFGERNILADVNDGSSLVAKAQVSELGPLGKSTGDVALAANGDALIALTTELPEVDPQRYDGRGASRERPGRLRYYVTDHRNLLHTGLLFASYTMTGSPSVLPQPSFGRILVAYPSSGDRGFTVAAYQSNPDNSLYERPNERVQVRTENPHEVTLMSTPGGRFFVVAWNETTREIHTYELLQWSPLRLGPQRRIEQPRNPDSGVIADRIPITSNSPPALAWNSRLDLMMLLTTEDDGSTRNRLKLWSLSVLGADQWVNSGRGTGRWLAGPGAATADRPAFVFDDNPRGGQHGRYLVYFREFGLGDGDLQIMHFVRVVPRGPADAAPLVFRQRRVINEWTNTRNPPVVAKYRDDHIIGWREGIDPENESHNRFNLAGGATGEYTAGMTDHDDVTHIATRGLRESLLSVR